MKGTWEWWGKSPVKTPKKDGDLNPDRKPSSISRPRFLTGCWTAFFVATLFCGVPFCLVLKEMAHGISMGVASSNFDRGFHLFQSLEKYTIDHGGRYPKGNSSTEIFQILLDEHYIDSASQVYVKMPGRTQAVSPKLKSKNVCWDLTWCEGKVLPEYTPSVFLTGFRVEYRPEGSAIPLWKLGWFESWQDVYLPALFQGSGPAFDRVAPDGILHDFVPKKFDPKGKVFVQLTPEGPLKP